MNREERPPSFGADRAITCGATYDHTTHGRVEVTDIWHGTGWVNSVNTTEGPGTTVVRFLLPEGDTWQDELIEQLPEFLEAIH